MDPDFWHQRWQEGKIGFHQDAVNRHLLDYWQHLNLASGATVFVPLCGKSLDMLWLLDRGYRVVGVEINSLAIEAFFAENQLTYRKDKQADFTLWQGDNILILEGDFFALSISILGKLDAVFDRAALIALPEPMRLAYVTHLRELLSPATPALLVTLDYPQAEMQGPPFAVSPDEVQRLYSSWCWIEEMASINQLSLDADFRERGLSKMHELVFYLRVN